MTQRTGIPLLAAALGIFAAAAAAFEPELPSVAKLTASRASELDSFEAPIGAFDGSGVPKMTVEGAIDRRAWRIDAKGVTPLQVIMPLRDQLVSQGFGVIFDCDTETCGGFDFRFGIEVLPGPNMYVNLTQFRYLTAFSGPVEAPEKAVGLLVSTTADAAYVQMIAADTGVAAPALPVAAPPEPLPVAVVPPAVEEESMEAALEARGRVVLSDLDFATGTSDLGPGPFASLEELTDLLQRRPGLRVALVGHTDTVGGLQVNINVSKARAQSVRSRLVSEYGVPAARLEAEGMGYLAPVASNLTEEGRARNRRVEAILLSEN